MKRSLLNTLFYGAVFFGLPFLSTAQETVEQSSKTVIKINGTTVATVSKSEKSTSETSQNDSEKKDSPPANPVESKGASEPSAITGGTTLSLEDKRGASTPKTTSAIKKDVRAKWEADVNSWKGERSVIEGSEATEATNGSHTSFGKNLVIRKKLNGDVSSFGSSTAVLSEINGSVVVFGGDAIILAPIHGDVTVIGGNAKIDSKVDGTVTAIGGEVIQGANAVVDEESSISLGGTGLGKIAAAGSAAGIFKTFFFSKALLLWRFALLAWNVCISLLLISLFSNSILNSDSILRDRRGACFITGFVWTPIYWLLLVGAFALCFILVGIPILLLLWILNFALETFGLTVVGFQFGRWLLNRFNQPDPSEHLAVFTGICALGILRVLPLIGSVVWWIVCWFGIGAALINLFSKKEQAPPSLSPAPAPIPNQP